MEIRLAYAILRAGEQNLRERRRGRAERQPELDGAGIRSASAEVGVRYIEENGLAHPERWCIVLYHV